MNTEIEKIKRAILEIISVISLSSNDITIKHQLKDVQIKLLKEESTKPKGYQGLNKAYILSGLIMWVDSAENGKLYGYGLFSDGKFQSAFCYPMQIEREATSDEWKEAIKK